MNFVLKLKAGAVIILLWIGVAAFVFGHIIH